MLGASILIVEDDEAFRKMLSQVLNIRGYKVAQAQDKETALEQVQEHPEIKVVIQDLGLPPEPQSMSYGLQTMREILEICPRKKVIVLTGRGRQDAAVKAISDGAFDFFEKPVSTEALISGIERALMFFDAESSLQKDGTYAVHDNFSLEVAGLKATKDDFEAKIVIRVLQDLNFNVRLAAERLGIRRENLYYLIRKHNIELDKLPMADFNS